MLPKTLTFVDVETTGFSPNYHRITEVGIVIVKGGKIVDEYQTLVNPEQTVSYQITRITGITQADVDNAPYFSEVSAKIMKYFNDGLFTAHNAGFDYSFMKTEFTRAMELFDTPRLCTMLLSRKLFPEYRHHRLSDIIERNRIKVEEHHRALDDARATAEFYLKVQNETDDDVFANVVNKLIR